MRDVAVRVAKNLNFHVARALDQFFKVDVILAEGCCCFALGRSHFFGELIGIVNPAHTTTPAAPAGLDHDGQANTGAGFVRSIIAVREGVGRGDGGDVCRVCEFSGSDLVAKIDQCLRLWSDEGDASFFSRSRQFRRF